MCAALPLFDSAPGRLHVQHAVDKSGIGARVLNTLETSPAETSSVLRLSLHNGIIILDYVDWLRADFIFFFLHFFQNSGRRRDSEYQRPPSGMDSEHLRNYPEPIVILYVWLLDQTMVTCQCARGRAHQL